MSETRNWIYLEEIAEDQPLGTPRKGLVASIRRSGQMRSPLVRRREDGKHEVVAGQQWIAAARLAGRTTLDVDFEDGPDAADPLDRKRIASSLQCESMDQLFVAECLVRVLEKGGVTQADLAREFDMNRGQISNLVRVAESPDLVAMIKEEELAFGAAKVLAGLTEEEREPLLGKLRRHKAVHERFPSVVAITRMVEALLGEETTQTIPRRCVRALVTEMEARGREIVTEFLGTQRKRIQITLSVKPEDQPWIGELVGREPGDGAASVRAA
jgi:ParB/RepB/Spo0J family partition protein